MESMQSHDARTRWSDLLRAVDKGEHVEIRRYLTPLAVMVPKDWHDRALAALDGEDGEELAARYGA